MLQALLNYTVMPGTVESVLANVVIGLFFAAVFAMNVMILRKYN